MLPCKSADDETHAHFADMKIVGNAFLLFTGSASPSNLSDYVGGKFGIAVFTPGILRIWNSFFIAHAPALLSHVLKVLRLRSLKGMQRIEAGRVVAGMKHVQRLIKHWAGQALRVSMGANSLAINKYKA